MVTLHEAVAAERFVLENLIQLYVYDWSELGPFELGEDGRFEAPPLGPYWEDEERHPFLLRVDGALAGFALVRARSRLSGAPGVFDMAEFFVVRRHRRQGVGRAAARLVFERFRGAWEVRQRVENPAATAFWRSAIATFTGDGFEQSAWSDEKGSGVVQRFWSAS